MSYPNEKEKWGNDKVLLLVAVFVLLTVVVPLLIIFYVGHKFSQIQ